VTRVLIEEFPHAPGGHCGSTSMRDLLKFYGHEFTEDMVFGLGAGIDFMYVSGPSIEPPVYIGGRSPELEAYLCQTLGVGMELVTGLDAESGWLAVKELMDSGVPVLVHADVYYLDYLHAKRHFSAHRIVLVGYDDARALHTSRTTTGTRSRSAPSRAWPGRALRRRSPGPPGTPTTASRSRTPWRRSRRLSRSRSPRP